MLQISSLINIRTQIKTKQIKKIHSFNAFKKYLLFKENN